MAARVEARDAGDQQGHEQPGHEEGLRPHLRRHLDPGPAPSGARACARAAPGGRRSRGRGVRRPRCATTSPVITASPMPMTVCQPTIATSTVPVSTGAVPPIANRSEKTSAATGHAHQGADRRGRRDHRQPARQHRLHGPEDEPADDDADQRHQGDVGAERGDAAVGHEQRLDQQDDADAQHGGERPDQHGGHRATEEVSAGAGADREVHHLAGEHERRHQAGHRGGAVVELTPRAAQRHRDSGGRHDSGRDRRRRVEESVGDVHPSPLAGVQ